MNTTIPELKKSIDIRKNVNMIFRTGLVSKT